MGLDVLPQSLDDDRSGLGVDAQHAGQSGVQLELRGLVCLGHSETALEHSCYFSKVPFGQLKTCRRSWGRLNGLTW